MSYLPPSTPAEDEELNARQKAAYTKTSSDNCCEQCRRDKKRCKGGPPCDRCFNMGRACSLLGEHIVSMRGCTSSLTGHNDGYFVVYNLPDGNVYMAHLDRNYQLIGQTKYLGHKFALNAPQYSWDFSVDDLFAPGLADACERHIHQDSGSSQNTGH
ncbi:hypothetical protein SCHPADRAFT_885650 [Schizopora paradoxa]|uniref:Zn(2)-C6 fungal-type domain-containing protein n=1 Tax=Schizopora paradoxa TaxID=27342 RepID=A0A0H2S4R7_9AGAM|nr:hypothetical protein SCHPADRAFT_885650 [Schizopora paradoxa]